MAYKQRTILLTKVENGYFVTVGKKGYICNTETDVKNLVEGGTKDLITELNSEEDEVAASQG